MKYVICKKDGIATESWVYKVVKDEGKDTVVIEDEISGVHWNELIEVPRKDLAEISEEEYMMVFNDEECGAQMGDLLAKWVERGTLLTP